MLAFVTPPANAQWGLVPSVFPATEIHNGLTGIGRFTPPSSTTPTFLPARLLHIHSENFGVSSTAVHHPAFLRLQTQSQNFGAGSNVNYFGQTGIEFFSGSDQNNGAGGWCVGKILGIHNGLGIDPNLPTPLFQPNDPVEIDLRGGLAFFCSVAKSTGLPMDTDKEVMRIVDGMVGIGTTKPKEMLQIYEKMTFHVGANEYYMGYNQNSLVENGALVMRRFWEVPQSVLDVEPNYSPLSATMGVMFKEDHNLMYLTNSGKGLAGSVVNLAEPSGAVKGITIGNNNTNVENNGDQAFIGLGAAADADSRVFIRGLTETSATKNALRVANSSELYGTPFTRFVVKDNGNVGIGIDAVKAKFQIGTRFGTFADNSNSVFTHNAYYDGSWKRITDGVAPGGKPAAIGMSDGTITLKVGTTGTSMLPDAAITWTTGLSIANDGKVTIGTLSGSVPRAVYATASGELIATSEPTGWSLDGNNVGTNSVFIGTLDSKPLIFKTEGIQRMELKNDGDVQIGEYFISRVTLPLPENMNMRLTVDGQIVAKNLLIQKTGWADYVFNDSYRLMPLQELENYVKVNKHLPEIPTEAEVNDNGIDIVAVQTTLLKKVEELTLYMIELEKKNKHLQTRVEELERK